MTKSSSKEVVLKTALIIAIISVILIFITEYFIPQDQTWIKYMTIPVVILISSYYIILSFFQNSMLNRVSGIYKDIKRHKKEDKILEEMERGKDPLKKAEHDVSVWTKEKIEEMKDLIEADNYRKEFIGNLAHELKTPIFSVQGYILTLLEGDAIEDPKVNKKFLQKAEKGVERLVSLVEDLDAVAKIESGVYHPEMSKFNVNVLVTEVIDSLDQVAQKHNITLVLEGKENVNTVLADRKRIQQVLTNLISNSISYGNNQGTTTILIEESKKKFTVHVKDNGIGIAKDNIKRLFERFYRVDKSRSRSQGGSGLGLSIVKHIIEAHDQQITVESEAGKGSIFSFTLKKG